MKSNISMFGIVAAMLLGASVGVQSINTIADVTKGEWPKILTDAPFPSLVALAFIPSLFQKKKSGGTPKP